MRTVIGLRVLLCAAVVALSLPARAIAEDAAPATTDEDTKPAPEQPAAVKGKSG